MMDRDQIKRIIDG